jgi:hypothetical protein
MVDHYEKLTAKIFYQAGALRCTVMSTHGQRHLLMHYAVVSDQQPKAEIQTDPLLVRNRNCVALAASVNASATSW